MYNQRGGVKPHHVPRAALHAILSPSLFILIIRDLVTCIIQPRKEWSRFIGRGDIESRDPRQAACVGGAHRADSISIRPPLQLALQTSPSVLLFLHLPKGFLRLIYFTMSTLEDLDDLERENQEKKQQQGDGDGKKPDKDGDADMKDADAEKKEEEDDIFDEEILRSSTEDIIKRRRMLENELRIMKSEYQRLTHEQNAMKEKIKDNMDKIENNRFVRFLRRKCVDFDIEYFATDNYRTSSVTLSSCSIWTLRRRRSKKGQISTSTQHGSGSPPSSRHQPVKPSSSL